MRSLPLLVFAALLLPVVAPVASLAQPGGRGMYEGMPFGQSCPGPRGGGPYGARRPVATADQAKKMVKTYFSSQGVEIRLGKMEERGWYFEAEILDPDGTMIDKVIVDKRAGRIRSIY